MRDEIYKISSFLSWPLKKQKPNDEEDDPAHNGKNTKTKIMNSLPLFHVYASAANYATCTPSYTLLIQQ